MDGRSGGRRGEKVIQALGTENTCRHTLEGKAKLLKKKLSPLNERAGLPARHNPSPSPSLQQEQQQHCGFCGGCSGADKPFLIKSSDIALFATALLSVLANATVKW